MTQIAYHYSVERLLVERLSPSLVRRAVNRGASRAASKIGRQWKRDAKAAAPVRTGRLRRGLRVQKRRLRSRTFIATYQLRLHARNPRDPSKTVLYFAPVEARTNFGKDAFKKRESEYQQLLAREIWSSLREAWTTQFPGTAFPSSRPSFQPEDVRG